MRSLSFCSCAFVLFSPAFAGAQNTAETKLDLPALTAMLKGLGYEPEAAGDSAQRVTVERDKFTFRITFSVSGNTKKVWMSSYLVEIPDLTRVPSSALTGVLLSNGDIGPAHFYLVKTGDKHWLKIGFALDNRNITPAYLRSEMDWFMDRMSDTATLWDKAKWTPGG